MFQSRRTKRINRALSAVLQSIDDRNQREHSACETWADLDNLSIRTNSLRNYAYKRAKVLHARWQARVAPFHVYSTLEKQGDKCAHVAHYYWLQN